MNLPRVCANPQVRKGGSEMDFAFNEEQKMLRDSARDFLKSECPKTVISELEESEKGYSPKLWKKMAQLDWMSIIVPEAYDGMGWSLLDLAVQVDRRSE